MLSHHDVADLEWYFGLTFAEAAPSLSEGGTLFGGHVPSPLGAQLERAALFHTDSDGDTVPPAGSAEVLEEAEDGTLSRRWSAWPHMYVKKVAPAVSVPTVGALASESADPDEDDRRRHLNERRSRIASRLGQLEGDDYTALRGLYGERGLYWANREEAGQRRHRVWVLLPLTRLGRRELDKSGLDANTWLHALADPRGLRPKWLDAAVDQAERLERRATAAYAKTRTRRADDDDDG